MPKDLISSGRLRVGVNVPDGDLLSEGAQQGNFIGDGNQSMNCLNFGGVEGYNFRLGWAKGTIAGPLTVADGDLIAEIEFWAYTGATGKFQHGSEIQCFVSGAVVANLMPPTRLVLNTSIAGAQTPVLFLEPGGEIGAGTRPVTAGNNHGAIQIGAGSPVSGIYLGNASNAGAHVLDNYEEGAWTPEIDFGGNSVGVTYVTRNGSYTRIGNRMFYKGLMLLSSKGTSVGVCHISLPPGFPVFNDMGDGGMVSYYQNLIGIIFPLCLRTNSAAPNPAGTVTPTLNGPTGSGDTGDGNYQNNAAIFFSGTYELAT